MFVIGGTQGHYYDEVCDLHLSNVLFQRENLKLDVHEIGKLPGFQAMFGMHRLRSAQEFRSRFRLSPADLSIALTYINALEEEILSKPAGCKYAAHAYFMLLVVFLSRLYSQQNSFDSDAVLRLAKVISYIETHFTEDLCVEQLAKTAGMSERVFLDAFHGATGNSPYSYLLDLRINRAAEALSDMKRKITDIAFSCGFNDSNYFSRQFKKRMGISPAEYRQRITSI